MSKEKTRFILLKLRVAGLIFGLEMDQQKWIVYCREKFSPFLSKSGQPDFHVRVIFVRSGSLRSIRFRYRSARRSDLFFPNSLRYFQHFNYAIKNMFSQTMLLHRGCLIHGSSISIGEHAVIFAGKSGKGKSTAAACSGQAVLADDRSLTRIIRGKSHVFGSPFYEAHPFVKRDRKKSLAAIFLLTRGIRATKQIKISRLSPTEAVFRLVPHVVIREETPLQLRKKQLEYSVKISSALAQKIPVYTLSYDKTKASRKEFFHAISRIVSHPPAPGSRRS